MALTTTRTWGNLLLSPSFPPRFKMLSLHVTYSSWVGSPHVSSSPIKYKFSAKLQSPTDQAPGPKKTSVPPAPQTRSLKSPRPVPRLFPHRRPRPGSRRCLSPFCDPAAWLSAVKATPALPSLLAPGCLLP